MAGVQPSGESSGGGLGDAVELTILMPCLNEVRTLPHCVTQAMDFLSRSGVTGEVLIADNGSVDGSIELARRLGARVIEVVDRGYGSALAAGIGVARGRFVVMGDADASYDFSRLESFLERLRLGADLVMGNRFQGGIADGAMPFLHRRLGNPVLTGLGRLFFRCPVGDFHCGLRGFRRSAVLGLDLQTTGMEFATEMVVKASLLGLRVVEVPTTLAKDGRDRPPHLRTWRDGWRHLRFLLLYSPRWLFLYPGLGCMGVGLVVMTWIWGGPRRVTAGVVLDVHTLLYAAMAVVIGYQAVVFALFTKVFAIGERLLPADARLDRWFRWVTLEVGLVVGVVLGLLGVTMTVHAVRLWQSVGFGSLDSSSMLRNVIPAVTCLVLGGQTVLASFFLSVLGLRRRGAWESRSVPSA